MRLSFLIILINLYYALANSISSIHLYAYYNARQHHTVQYENIRPDHTSDLVLRRASSFNLAVRTTERFNAKQSKIQLRIQFGPNPSEEDGSSFLISVDQVGVHVSTSSWTAVMIKVKSDRADLLVNIPPNASVGLYRINYMLIENDELVSSVNIVNKIYILFNPWSKSDTVYMPDPTDLDEYVLNPLGMIYMGSAYAPDFKEWPYDQFQITSLQAAIYLIDIMNLSMEERANPVSIARIISQKANANDLNGILAGKWEEPYEPGRNPLVWMSSGEILKEFVDSGGSTVQFGQCWVFAGIATTLTRTLGIPSRTLTIYSAAHDTDKSLTIDTFYDPYGNQIQGPNFDSIWNYHCITTVWMSRPDLSGKYSAPGWQVIDATPQEPANDGLFKMGPASVEATKDGQVLNDYEMPFLYAEVNADQIRWLQNFDGTYTKLSVETSDVGGIILTKKKSPLGSNYYIEPEDVTSEFKFIEGTDEERQSIMIAGKNMNIPYVYDPSITQRKMKADVHFKFTTEQKQTLGDDLIIKYVLTNRASIPKTVFLNFNVRSIYYSGKDGYVLYKNQSIIKLGPNENRNFTSIIIPEDYFAKSMEFNQYKATAFVRIEEKDVDFVEEIVVVLSKPRLVIKRKIVDRTDKLNIELNNPFKFHPLTNCTLMIKDTNRIEKTIDDIPAGLSFKYNYKPVDKAMTIFMLNCAELKDIRGSNIMSAGLTN